MHLFQQYFSYIFNFTERQPQRKRKPADASHKQNVIIKRCFMFTLPHVGSEMTIDVDRILRCKFNYHTIVTTTLFGAIVAVIL